MLIAQNKIKENIIEYLLYMFQVEDILRAYQFDMNMIRKFIIDKFNVDPLLKEDVTIWYADLLQKMLNQGIQEKGHLEFIRDLLKTLEDLSSQLISVDIEYKDEYMRTKPDIELLKAKFPHERIKLGDIEVCINALYGIYLLRLQQVEISEDTREAAVQISRLLTKLAKSYHSGFKFKGITMN